MIQTIDVFFRILNFLVVLVGIFYIIQRYAIPFIKDFMAQEKQTFDDLHRKNNDIQQQRGSIEQEYADQEEWFNSIEEKFMEWQKTVEQRQHAKESLQQEIVKNMQERYDARLYAVSKKKFVKQEVLPMLDTVRDSLMKQYKKSADQKNYVHKLVNAVKERS